MNLENSKLLNKKIILRTDFNIPIINGIIQSTNRIDKSIETINYILNQKPKQLIIISHLGRPCAYDKDLSLVIIKNYLQTILNEYVDLCNLDNLSESTIILLENIRFYKEETKILNTTNDFRHKLTNLGDVFINDAFACSHRPHSSIIGINTNEKYFGFLMRKELKFLNKCLDIDGNKTLILGGSKINEKIKLIKNLIPKVDTILIGGGMAFTFLKYFKINIGKSLFDEEGFKLITQIYEMANKHKTKIILPIDYVTNDNFSNEGNIQYFEIDIDESFMGLDIGERTCKKFINYLKDSDLILWNGPLGVFEFDNFSNGSRTIMQYISNLEATTIIGGGDTTSCCEKFHLENKMNHVSTGGGATLELLEGTKLSGVEFIIN